MLITKESIIKELKDLASNYSFIRIIGYACYTEYIGADNYLEKSLRPTQNMLLTSEINFLCGLWIANVNLSNKKWDISKDISIIERVYELMDILHSLYRPHDESSRFKELVFYEGDEGYDWQFTKFAKQKYDSPLIRKFLKSKNYDIDYLESTVEKIRKITEKHARIFQKKLTNEEYYPCHDIFIIRPKEIKENFVIQEQEIIDSLSIELGTNHGNDLNDISDFNTFLEYPIIKLPYKKGLLVPSLYTLSLSINETPYYWLSETNNKHYDQERGENAENIIYNIINGKIENRNVLNHIIIKRHKTGPSVTDVDVLMTINDLDVIFQVKTKRLTMSSKQGNIEKVKNDFTAAVINAYNQGLACVECLIDYESYYSLKNIPKQFINKRHYIVVCVVVDEFPTITSTSIQLLQEREPLIAMTALDLDAIFDILSQDEIHDYFLFRENLVKNKIIGINEMYYLGSFIYQRIGYGIPLNCPNIIDIIAAKFADYLLNMKQLNYAKINNINEIRTWLDSHPLPEDYK